MKKYFCFLAVLAFVLAGCKPGEKGGEDEPNLLSYQGDWYCYQEKADGTFKVEATAVIVPVFSMDSTMHIDTTFAEPVLYRLTADNWLVREQKDTLASYTFDEVENELILSTDRALRNAGIDATIATMIGMPATVRVPFAYNEKSAGASLAMNDANTLTVSGVTVSYSYDIKGKMYLRRSKEGN